MRHHYISALLWRYRGALVMLALAVACSEEPPESGQPVTAEDIADDTGADARVDVKGKDTATDGAESTGDGAETSAACETPQGFGCPCTSAAECTSGYCVQALEGSVCTRTCSDDCPATYRCVILLATCPDCAQVCVPDVPKQCAPCQLDADCFGGRCLATTDGSKHCADPCDATHPCDAASTCTPSELPTGKGASYCLPNNGTCDCTAKNQGASRPCTVQNALGICAGIETCDVAKGWQGCTAKTPSAEVCNGFDDDCDGFQDDEVPEVGGTCTKETPSVGTCVGKRICSGAAGLQCDAKTPAVESCNASDDDCNGTIDDPFTTGGQYLSAQHCGACGQSCEGKVPHAAVVGCALVNGAPTCVPTQCAEGYSKVSETTCVLLLGSLCKPCLVDGDCAAGTGETCVSVGSGSFCSRACGAPNLTDCPEGFACADPGTGSVCLLKSGGCGFQGKACKYDFECEDLSVCTTESCSANACAVTVLPCDDLSACTTDVCDPKSGCSHAALPDGTACDDGSGCTQSDACGNGACAGTQKVCDDGLACTTDTCSGDGVCAGTADAGSCVLDGVCVATGTGKAGDACLVCDPSLSSSAWSPRPDGTQCDSDGTVCTTDTCAAGACGHVPNTASCDDLDACTTADTCAAGQCAGVLYVCDDGHPCTVDTCDGAGGCTAPVAPGACLVEGACTVAGALSPTDPCKACDPATSPTEYSPRPADAPCNDGTACTVDDRCKAGTCAGDAIDCDDGNVCTDDACDSLSGCTHLANTVACNDGLYCTVSDTCDATACHGTPRDCGYIAGACADAKCSEEFDACVAIPKENGSTCDDSQPCTGTDTCVTGVCVGKPLPNCCKKDADCNDSNPCTVDTCDLLSGGCTNVATATEGQACDDGAYCTVAETCQSGKCLGSPRDCASFSKACGVGVCDETKDQCTLDASADGTPCPDDTNGCTDDLCVGGACTHPPATRPCDDLVACTHTDTCQNGSCIGTSYGCGDGLACTSDSCNGDGSCAHVPTALTCAIDGACYALGASHPANPCLGCVPATATDAWSPIANGAPCNDGEACTKLDACASGACKGTPTTCAPTSSCTVAACDGAGGCNETVVPGSCWVGGVCYADGAVNPDNACEACDAQLLGTGFSARPNGTGCDDQKACTHTDACTAGTCGGTAYVCDDGLSCTDNVCDGQGGCGHPLKQGTCLVTGTCYANGESPATAPCLSCQPSLSSVTLSTRPDAAPCTDGNPCTQGDACAAGACLGTPYVCDDGLSCTSDACDGQGGCTHPQKAGTCFVGGVCAADGAASPQNPCLVCSAATSPTGWTLAPTGAPCSDGTKCTSGDTCQSGVCTGAGVSCDDQNPCTDDACEAATGCTHSDNVLPCSDGKYCTTNDTCASGSCQGAARDCSAQSAACTLGTCDEALDACVAAAVSNGTACNDGQACTNPDTCQSGACTGTVIGGCCTTDAQCDDQNVCTHDTCILQNGTCSHDGASLAGTTCNDGKFCTEADTCQGGQCLGTARDCGAQADVCNAGVCDEVKDACVKDPNHEGQGCTSDQNPCTDDLCQGGACLHVANAAPCNDGEPCTANDLCASAACVGTPYVCNDGLACTTDACNGAGGCVATVAPGMCAIAGVCVQNGTSQPGNGCATCVANTNPTAWTSKLPGASCDDGSACTSKEACVATALGTVCQGQVDKDTDLDGAIDVGCPDGTDCNDQDPTIEPGVPDPVNAIATTFEVADFGGAPGKAIGTAVDVNGGVHLVYTNTVSADLEYATNRFGFWATASLDVAGDVGSHAAVATDASGAAHVVYYDATGKDLKYATNETGSWTTATVSTETANDVGRTPAALVDAAGTLHVVYEDASSHELLHRSRSAGLWSAPAVVAPAVEDGLSPSLTRSTSNTLHVSYFAQATKDARYATNATGIWTTELIDAGGDVGDSSAIALAPDGTPRVLYRDMLTSHVRFARRTGGTWTAVTAIASPTPFGALAGAWSLAADSDGTLVACVTAWEGSPSPGSFAVARLRNATTTPETEASWSVEWLSRNLDGATGCAQGVRSTNGKHHQAWFDTDNLRLMETNDETKLPGWVLVDGLGTRGEYPSLARSTDGALHAAYWDRTLTALRYAVKAPNKTWASEVVDDPANVDVGKYASIAIDSKGKVHIAYFDETTDDLKYVTGTAGSWTTPVVVEAQGNVGTWASLALGANDVPFVSYWDATARRLKVASKASGSWSNETVDTTTNTGEYTSIAVGTDGKVHVAYHLASTAADLRYVRGKPGAWEAVQTIAVTGTVGQYTDIAVDSSGNPHISHSGSGSVYYTTSDAGGVAGSWTTTKVGNGGPQTAIVLDSAGKVVLAFPGTSGLTVARAGLTGFTSAIVDPTSTAWVSLVADGTGWAAAYHDVTNLDLRVAGTAQTAYTGSAIVTQRGTVGLYTSLAIDEAGTPHLAYYDSLATALKYARRAEGTWYRTFAANDATVGLFAQLAVRDGVVHLAWRDSSGQDLEYARLENGAFTYSTVDTSIDPGKWIGLAVDAEGLAHISYYDEWSNDLRYAVGSPAGWSLATLDSLNTVGTYSSITLDAAGKSHVAYRYETGGDLRYANNVSGAWTAPLNVETTGDVGSYSSIALDQDEHVFIAHRSTASTGDLRIASNQLGVWTTSVVDNLNNVGAWARLVRTGPRNLYIGYQDETAFDTKLALSFGADWQVFKIDTTGQVGAFLGLAVAPDKKVWLSYQDATSNTVRVAIVTLTNTVDQDCDGF